MDILKPKSKDEIEEIYSKIFNDSCLTVYKEVLNKTLISISAERNIDEILFIFDDGVEYRMHHEQDCCEEVTLEDINGDLDDLIGSPLLVAEEHTNDTFGGSGSERYLWTFYKFATIKGYVIIRWYGSSNGYYSESVNFRKQEMVIFKK